MKSTLSVVIHDEMFVQFEKPLCSVLEAEKSKSVGVVGVKNVNKKEQYLGERHKWDSICKFQSLSFSKENSWKKTNELSSTLLPATLRACILACLSLGHVTKNPKWKLYLVLSEFSSQTISEHCQFLPHLVDF